MCANVGQLSVSKKASVTLKIVEKIAEREKTDPAELNPPLHTVINTEALEALYQSTPNTDRTAGTVEFEYMGYQVKVNSSGDVQIGETISFSERSEPSTQSAVDTVSD